MRGRKQGTSTIRGSLARKFLRKEGTPATLSRGVGKLCLPRKRENQGGYMLPTAKKKLVFFLLEEKKAAWRFYNIEAKRRAWEKRKWVGKGV